MRTSAFALLVSPVAVGAWAAPLVHVLLNAIDKTGCEFSEASIACCICRRSTQADGQTGSLGTLGGFQPEKGVRIPTVTCARTSRSRGTFTQIRLCAGPTTQSSGFDGMRTPSELTNTIRHELIHQFDHCRAYMNWQDSRQLACSEESSHLPSTLFVAPPPPPAFDLSQPSPLRADSRGQSVGRL